MEYEYNDKDELLDKIEKDKEDEIRILLGLNYEILGDIIYYYLDISEEQKNIISIWIISTYVYKTFSAFPYLFFNAMRGSGKSRTLNLISCLAWKGKFATSLTESVMFRSEGTLCIDEFEGVGSKEKQNLRELLNASYKKGITISRMRKKKGFDGEQQVIEEFEPYKPICMANIWGMDDVLGDRCINLILEKSDSGKFNMIIEDFDKNLHIKALKSSLENLQVGLQGLVVLQGYICKWNKWVKSLYNTTNTTNTTNTSNTINTTMLEEENVKISMEENEFFVKIAKTGLFGRDLELFFPLLIISKILSEDILNKTLEFATKFTKSKKMEELTENKDIMLYKFISEEKPKEFHKIKELTSHFRVYLGEEEKEENWINPKWFGRALKRLNLILQKRSVKGCAEVILDVEKAKTKSLMFKSKEEKKEAEREKDEQNENEQQKIITERIS